MKVMQVLYSGLGGHGSVVTSLIDADASKEWEHCLLFYGVEDMLQAYKDFCEERRLNFSYIKKRKGLFWKEFRSVFRELRKEKPDAVLLHSPSLILLPVWWYCRRSKCKLIVIEHTSNQVKGFLEYLMGAVAIWLAKKVVYLSTAYQGQMVKKFRWLPVLKKSVVIPNGIDISRYIPVEKPVDVTDVIHAGMIGRFLPPKNQFSLVEALDHLRHNKAINTKIILHFAGNGGSEESLKEVVQKKGLQDQVVFHGLLNEKQIILFLQGLDFYVHASYAETMCTAVMQAMACGLPVLASDIPGINNIVEADKNALLFKNDDIAEMLEKLRQLQDAALRKEMGEYARQFAMTHFSARQTFQQYSQVITNHTKR